MSGPPQPEPASQPPTSRQLDRLRDTVAVALVPGDAGYETARSVWNGRFEGRPDAVVRAGSKEDVVAAVDWARGLDIPVGVKSGGHDYAGRSAVAGGLLVDLSAMRGVEIDPDGRIARVQGGATWGELDAAAQRHGLAAPGPTVSTVGVSGSTLGGGSGWLLRRHGLALDSLLAVDLVTARGEAVRASADENPELFWAMRGAGANFGVVTGLELGLHAVGPTVVAGQVIHRLEDARAVLGSYRDIVADAPDALMAYAFLLRVPPVEGFLEPHHGEVVLSLAVCHSGPEEEAEAELRPLRELGDPLVDTVEPVSYVALQQSFDAALPAGQRYVSRAHYLPGLGEDLIDTVLHHAAGLKGEFTMAYFEPVGGAAGRVPADATAFPHRDAAFSFHLLAGWAEEDRDPEMTDWAAEFHAAVAPHSTGGVYVNLLSGTDPGRIRDAYGPAYERLRRIKARWDPANRFRGNHNVPPAGSPT